MTRRPTPNMLGTAMKDETLDAIIGSATDLDIAAIRTDAGTQPRAKLDDSTVANYAERMRDGVRFPPVVVFHDGTDYILADGFHRIAAARLNGAAAIPADVRQGTVRDAILYSVGANAAHGLPRSNDDKRRAVLRLLEDGEWGQWSDREIARRTATSHTFVANLRENLTGNIASEKPRQYITKHGTPTVMNTERIGRTSPVAQAAIVATLREWVKAWDEWNTPLEALLAGDTVIIDDLKGYLPGKVSKDEIKVAAAALLADIRPARAGQPEPASIDAILAAWAEQRYAIPAQRRQALTDMVRQGPQNTSYWNSVSARMPAGTTAAEVRAAASRLLVGSQPVDLQPAPDGSRVLVVAPNGAGRPAAAVTFAPPKATDMSLAELRNALLELFTLPASATNLDILQAATTAHTIAKGAVNA